jgi:hypothetical protein
MSQDSIHLCLSVFICVPAPVIPPPGTIRMSDQGYRCLLATKAQRHKGTERHPVIPAKAGIQGKRLNADPWAPAFAGATDKDGFSARQGGMT